MSLFTKYRTWFLSDTKRSVTVEGQFEATSVVESGWGGEYAEHFSLNSSRAITQFLHGQTQKVTFEARLRARDSVINNVLETLSLLKVWTQKDSANENRPPILTFWIGDAHV